MYTPGSFKVDDPQVLQDFIRQYSFATLITCETGVPHGTHLPMLLQGPAGEGGSLVFHMARANPQWRHFNETTESLAIFTGRHAYISPSFYQSTPNVPTWNYTAVHVYGHGRLVEDQTRFADMLSQLVEFYEADRPDRWNYNIPTEYRDTLMKAIVGVELQITRIEGKFKLSQNRPEEIAHVRQALGNSDLGKLM